MYFVWISEQTAIIPYTVLTDYPLSEEMCVLCEVVTGILHTVQMYTAALGDQAGIRKPSIVEGRVRYQVSLRETCSGQSGTVTDFSPSTCFLPSASLHQCSAVISTLLLSERQKTGKLQTKLSSG